MTTMIVLAIGDKAISIGLKQQSSPKACDPHIKRLQAEIKELQRQVGKPKLERKVLKSIDLK